MADNIKISQLDALTAAQNSTVVPVVDGGTTKQMSLSTLQTHLTASFATPANLSSEVSTLNSTINALTTDDIAEGTNQYFTNARVDARLEDIGAITSSAGVDLTQTENYISGIKARLDEEGVYSSSIQISASMADAGFGSGGGGGGSVPNGTLSSSAQISEYNRFLEFNGDNVLTSSAQLGRDLFALHSNDDHVTIISSSASGPLAIALTVNTGSGGGGGGGTDYIENITFSGTTLTFTGVGNAFASTVDLSTGDLVDTTDLFGYLPTSVYQTDSASFAARITSGGGGGGSVPNGTVSSSAQTIQHINTANVVSSSAQIDVSQADLSSLTLDDITNGVTNRYYSDSLVLSYINSIQVLSGSAGGGGGFTTGGTGIVSASQQVSDFGFVLTTALNESASTLQSNIDAIQGVSAVDVNDFTATQKFRDIEVTGSLRLNSGAFSGSGAQLFNIPASAIDGTVPVAATSLSDGNNSVTANSVVGITLSTPTGSILANGNIIIQSGSLISGSGAGLFDIPSSAIIGGVGAGSGNFIASGSITASIDPTIGLVVNSNISASGDVTARSIVVGTSGTPTIYSANNLNLSASNAVVITDSPLRLTPFTNATTASFSFSEGDLVYSADSNDFYGYRVIDGTGSMISLTAGGAGSSVDWGQIIGIPTDLVSSSAQLGDLGAITSSAQLVPNIGTGDVIFGNSLGSLTSSANFRYTEGNETLTSPTMSVGVLSYNTLSGPAAATGSFNRVLTDSFAINGAYELPTGDGTVDQVIKTNGAGVTTFGNVSWAQLEGTPNGIISSSVQLPADIVYENASNTFTTVQVISSSLYVTESAFVDTLVLVPRTTTPTNPASGSIISSGSGATIKPYFWDGNQWNALY